MSVKDDLGKRMKEFYENVSKINLVRRMPVAISIDQDFSIKDQELLKELNNIICHVDNSYLWRELSEFDLKLRKKLKNNNINRETSIQQKAVQVLSEINKLDGEDNLFQYILCLLKYSILPAYNIKNKNLKTRLMEHLASHAGYELIDKEFWLKTQLFVLKNMFKNNN